MGKERRSRLSRTMKDKARPGDAGQCNSGRGGARQDKEEKGRARRGKAMQGEEWQSRQV